VAILDVEGTFIDTSYQHALCRYAFREHDIVLPEWAPR
jgi:hypothetical protein